MNADTARPCRLKCTQAVKCEPIAATKAVLSRMLPGFSSAVRWGCPSLLRAARAVVHAMQTLLIHLCGVLCLVMQLRA